MKQSISRSELIEIIKEILREMNEVSTTANVPGYQTPYAFSGGLAKNKKKKKDLIKRLHMKLVGKLDEGYSMRDIGLSPFFKKLNSVQRQAVSIALVMSGNMTGAVKAIEKIKKGLSKDKKVRNALRMANESINEGRYHEYRNDETRTPKQKIWHSVREVRDSLMKLERNLKHAIKLKNEQGMDSRTYYQYAKNSFPKIQEKLIKMAKKIGELSA